MQCLRTTCRCARRSLDRRRGRDVGPNRGLFPFTENCWGGSTSFGAEFGQSSGQPSSFALGSDERMAIGRGVKQGSNRVAMCRRHIREHADGESTPVLQTVGSRVAMLFRQNDANGVSQLYVQWRDDSGTWGLPSPVTDGDCYHGYGSLALRSDGALQAVWLQTREAQSSYDPGDAAVFFADLEVVGAPGTEVRGIPPVVITDVHRLEKQSCSCF